MVLRSFAGDWNLKGIQPSCLFEDFEYGTRKIRAARVGCGHRFLAVSVFYVSRET